MTSVLIADAESLVRQGLKFILEEEPDIRVVAEASNGDEAVTEYGRCKPDVAVLEIAMPQGEGLTTIEELMSLDPGARILVLTTCQPGIFANRAFKAGAMGYMTKTSSASELLRAVRVMGDRRNPAMKKARRAAKRHLLANPQEENPVGHLSNRELQVLWLMARGHRMSGIAATLGLSSKTVETYRERFARKLHIRTEADVYRFARRNGLA